MPTPQRATIAADLSDRIDRWLARATRWAAEDDFEPKLFRRDAEKLQRVDSVGGSECQAMVAQLSGDIETANRWINNLVLLGAKGRAEFLGGLIYSNLGYFRRAYDIIANAPELLERHNNARKFAFISAAFGHLASLKPADFGDDPGTMELIALSQASLRALATASLGPDHAAQAVDLAGEVLRRHKLFFVGELPIVHALDDGVLFELVVDAPAQQIAAMNNEYIEAAIGRDLDHQAFSFCFIGTA